jgi:serine/threonine protein phosphatase 1
VLVGDASMPDGLRVYAIGDVHGCDEALAAVHGRIADDLAARPVADHRIVHVGDYEDRGPASAAAIERLAAMVARDARVACLRGNHDQMLLDFMAEPDAHGAGFLVNGGKATLRAYGVSLRSANYARLGAELAAAMPEAHRRFLEALPLSLGIGDYFFCHAGIRPGVALAAQTARDLLWIRGEFLEDTRDHGAVIVHGHTVTETMRPEIHPNRIAIDTGAYAGGPLTCLVLEGRAQRFL